MIGEDFGFECGDPVIEETVVVAGALQAVLKPPVLLREIVDLLLQGDVLGDKPLEAVFGQIAFEVADAASSSPIAVRCWAIFR